MKLIFERSRQNHGCSVVPASDVESAALDERLLRKTPPRLPEISEAELSRHYQELSKQTYGVCDGFYPLGSCTMKYNPAVNEEAARLRGFTNVHPLQPLSTAQGCLEALYTAEKLLCEVTGMEQMTFQPAAGAHGELTGLLLIKAYHQARGDALRSKIIVPDSAHGTNPASASMAGFTVVNIPSAADGSVDLAALKASVNEETAGLMLTNPNTLGIFDKNIMEITKIIHDAGGLNYYDGANLNAVVGAVRPGDMGFDVIHLNLHKTFSTPHGGGGPGSGAVGVKGILAPFLPSPHVVLQADGVYGFENPRQTIGRVKDFYGNFLVVIRALCYLILLGSDGLKEAAENAVLNANYLKTLLTPYCRAAADGLVMHEFVLDLSEIKKETGVSAMDVAKAMLDENMHAPTMYFPLIVHEALMFEPTETESKETLDEAAQKLIAILKAAYTKPERLKSAPQNTPVGRPDDVLAARKPVLTYAFEAAHD